MKAKINILTGLTIGLFFAANTHAAIVDHGTYLTDTTSGLEWLDVTESINMSRNQVAAELTAGGKFSGWRYATGTEFLKLASNTTGQSMANLPAYYGLPANITLDSLVAMLGSTLDTYYLHFYGKTFDEYIGNSSQSQHYTIGLLSDEVPNQTGTAYFAGYLNDLDRNGNSIDGLQAYFVGFGPDSSGYNFGSYLVRTTNQIPEPETLALMGICIGALISVRRNKYQVRSTNKKPRTRAA